MSLCRRPKEVPLGDRATGDRRIWPREHAPTDRGRRHLGQRFTFGLGFGWSRRFRHRFVLAGEGFFWLGLFLARQFAAPAFEFFQREFKLGDCFAHLFGTTTELHPTEFGDNELEVFNLGLLRTDQRLEQGGVVG